MLDALLAQLGHHRRGGAEVQLGLVVGHLQQFPQHRLKHPEAVVLQVLGQVGVIAGHQGIALGLRQPDPPQAQDGGVDHVHQVRAKGLECVGDRRARERQLELWIEGQGHGRNAHHLCAHVALGCPLGAENHHLIAGRHQVLHRFGEPGDDAINLRQEGLGEEGDFQCNQAALMACSWVFVQAEVQRMRLRSQRSA